MAIDVTYHQADIDLLERLGAVDSPRSAHELSLGRWHRYTSGCRTAYQDSCAREVGRRPQASYLVFENETTSGPVDVMEQLSQEGKALYTEAVIEHSGIVRAMGR